MLAFMVMVIIFCTIMFVLLAKLQKSIELRKHRQRKAAFQDKLSGVKFHSYEELRQHWAQKGIRINLDGEFDPDRHGDLQETLATIDSAAQEAFDKWQRNIQAISYNGPRKRGTLGTKIV